MSSLPVAIAIAVGSWIAVPGGTWSPTHEQIADARFQLVPYVEQAAAEQHLTLREWSNYSFQYQGQSEGGAQIVFINAFCIAPPPYAQNQLVVVFDGGTCFFQAKYSPIKRQFFHVIFNGEA